MITIVGNLKGGTGKSTVAFNLAIWLLLKGKKTVVFDLDPQKTFTDVIDIREEEGYEPSLDLLDNVSDLESYRTKRSEVVVDIGTADFESMKKAITLADRIIVPIPPSQADIWSTQRFLKIIKEETSSAKKKPEVLGFINRGDTHIGVRETDEAEEAIDYLNGIKRIKQRLYQRTAFRRSFSEGLSVFEMQPTSKASKEFIAFASLLYPKLK